LLGVAAFVISAPLLWMILSSFKDVVEVWRFPPTVFPQRPTLSGYASVFARLPFGRSFFNSVFVSVSVTVLILLTSSLSGYVFGKFRFRWVRVLFVLVLSSMMIPGQLTIIQNFQTIRALGWINTYFALIIPAGISAFGIFMMRQFMDSIPDDYMDAARIDGLGEFQIFARVILPLCGSSVSALAIFAFHGSWNSLLWPLIMAVRPEMKTLPVAIAGLATVHSPLMELMLPAATVSVVPILVVFAIFQRQIIEGVAMTGIKG